MTQDPLRLVPIDRRGVPEDSGLDLGELGKDLCAATASLYEKVGFVPPWLGYLAVSSGRVVGGCGFTAPPGSGEVEIAYTTFPEFEGRGIATTMAHRLLTLARSSQPHITVIARTLPERNASTHILEKLGFSLRGTLLHAEDGEVWEWEIRSEPGTRRLA